MREDIQRRMSELNMEMLERRKRLNEQYLEPRLKEIQEECGALGHVKGRFVRGLVVNYYTCGYCRRN